VIYCEFLTEKVLPAIKEKWPDRNQNISVQQDGASIHIFEDDEEFQALARNGNWNIKLSNQAPKSPDTNVLDLSLFHSLQSKQWQTEPARNIDEMIVQVERVFNDFDPSKIDCAFLTLQTCLNSILEEHGTNDYKLEHIGKERMLRQFGRLPDSIPVAEAAIELFDLFNL